MHALPQIAKIPKTNQERSLGSHRLRWEIERATFNSHLSVIHLLVVTPAINHLSYTCSEWFCLEYSPNHSIITEFSPKNPGEYFKFIHEFEHTRRCSADDVVWSLFQILHNVITVEKWSDIHISIGGWGRGGRGEGGRVRGGEGEGGGGEAKIWKASWRRGVRGVGLFANTHINKNKK